MFSLLLTELEKSFQKDADFMCNPMAHPDLQNIIPIFANANIFDNQFDCSVTFFLLTDSVPLF